MKNLDKGIDDKYLLEVIKKRMADSNNWHRYNAAYMNWALYELYSEEKYIIAAYNVIQRDIEQLDPVNHDIYMSHTTRRMILDSYNKLKNL